MLGVGAFRAGGSCHKTARPAVGSPPAPAFGIPHSFRHCLRHPRRLRARRRTTPQNRLKAYSILRRFFSALHKMQSRRRKLVSCSLKTRWLKIPSQHSYPSFRVTPSYRAQKGSGSPLLFACPTFAAIPRQDYSPPIPTPHPTASRGNRDRVADRALSLSKNRG